MRRAALLFSVVAVLIGGCRNSPSASNTRATPVEDQDQRLAGGTHACADRLHEIAGAMLLYYSVNHRMAATLEELGKSPGGENIGVASCPVSGKKYAYEPEGVIGPDGISRVVVYDVDAVHGGLRVGIV